VKQHLTAAMARNRLFCLVNPSVLEEAVGHMMRMEVPKGTSLCTQGKFGANFFVVEKGSCSIIVDRKEVGRANPWQSFGELEILCGQARTATVTAVEASVVWVLSKPFSDSVRADSLEVTRKELTGAISLQNLPKTVISQFLCVGMLTFSTKGQEVMCAGDSALCVGIILKGEVSEKLKSKPGQRFSAGQTFGEEDTMDMGSRKVTVEVASKDAIIFFVDKQLAKQLHTSTDKSLSDSEQLYMNVLRTLDELAHVGTPVLEKLAQNCQAKVFPPGEIIVKGSEPDFVGLVMKGNVVATGGVSDFKVGEVFNRQAMQKIAAEKQAVLSPTATKEIDWASVTLMAGDSEVEVAALPVKAIDAVFKQDTSEGIVSGSSLNPKMCAKTLSDLEDIGLLGNGAYGSVRMVVDKESKEVYALKSYNREKIVKMQVEKHVENEKLMMLTCDHPFVLRLVGTFEDAKNWHMVLELVQGGDLFGLLDREEKLDNHTARFYMAGTLLALEHLHIREIVYRDLKPENLLICHRGYIKLADFGLAKKVEKTTKTFTVCGTPEYMSPELIGRKGHNRAVDYWSIGILIFEMLHGMPPFYDDNPMITYTKIFNGKIEWPAIINNTAKDLISRLLQDQPTKRLGCLAGGVDDIKQHAWMHGFDYEAKLRYEMKAPWVPKLKGNQDLSFFDP